jgi:peptidoglycan/LPS O-acetylase OafA/YrhL
LSLPPAPTAPAAAASDDGKLIGIELLRFASAVAVLVFHFQHFAFFGTTQPSFVASNQPFYPALRLFYTYGFYGVQVFWCISGFIFFWKYCGVVSQRRLGGYKFFVLRFSRLYPLHFATLLFVAAMQAVYFAKNQAYFIYPTNDVPHFILQLFMASNWAPNAPESFNGPIWSISIEVLVYCIFFFSLRYISSSAASVGAMIVVSALIQFSKISQHPVFVCVMFFYLGCLTAIVYSQVKNVPRYNAAANIASLAAMAAIIGLQFFYTVKPIYFLLIFSPALIFLCVSHVPATKLASRVLVVAGSMTYSSYLLHVPIQLTTATLATYMNWRIPVYSPAFFLSFLAATLLLSYFCFKYFEMPAQNYLRRRFK